MKSDDLKNYAVLAAIGIGGYYAFKFLKGAASALNPANPDNIVNSAVSSVVQTVTGGSVLSLGTGVYDWINPSQYDVYSYDVTSGHAIPNVIQRRSDSALFRITPGSTVMVPI